MSTRITDPTHLTICKDLKYSNRFGFSVYDEFFDGSIRFKVYEDRIVFVNAGLDNRNSTTVTKRKTGGFSFGVSADLPFKTGPYNFEQTEDERILYFK